MLRAVCRAVWGFFPKGQRRAGSTLYDYPRRERWGKTYIGPYKQASTMSNASPDELVFQTRRRGIAPRWIAFVSE